MPVIRLDDKREIEQFLRQDTFLHIYSLGDLDDFFWPYTTFYGLEGSGSLEAVILLYSSQGLSTLLALSNSGDATAELLRSIDLELPSQFYAHLSPGLEHVLGNTHDLVPHGLHYKMALRDRGGSTISTVRESCLWAQATCPISRRSIKTATRATGLIRECWKPGSISGFLRTTAWFP
jgi:hypothetical protein